MKFQFTTAACLAATAALSACSSGSGVASGAGNALETPAPASAAKLPFDGKTLTSSARNSSQWKRDFDNNTAALVTSPTATIKGNSLGGIDLTVNGRTLSFAASDITTDGYGFHLADDSGGIWTWSEDSMAQALDPANKRVVQVFDFYSDTRDGTGISGFAVVGTETETSAIATLPTATYTGWSRVRIGPTTGFDNWDTMVSEGRGDITLTADFGAGTVSGAVTKMQTRQPQGIDPTGAWSDISGELTLGSTAISGNGFVGDISADAAFATDVGTLDSGSSYSGTFFGAAGEEAAGAINLMGTRADTGNPFIAFGVWSAAK